MILQSQKIDLFQKKSNIVFFNLSFGFEIVNDDSMDGKFDLAHMKEDGNVCAILLPLTRSRVFKPVDKLKSWLQDSLLDSKDQKPWFSKRFSEHNDA
jgi:hypothetical protein